MPPRNHELGSLDLAEEVGAFVYESYEPVESTESLPSHENNSEDSLEYHSNSVDLGSEYTLTWPGEGQYEFINGDIFDHESGDFITEKILGFGNADFTEDHLARLFHFSTSPNTPYIGPERSMGLDEIGNEKFMVMVSILGPDRMIREEAWERVAVIEINSIENESDFDEENDTEGSEEEYAPERLFEEKIEEPVLVFDLNEVFLSQIAEMNVATEAVTEQVVKDEESHVVEAELSEQSVQSVAPVQQIVPKSSRAETVVAKDVAAPVIEAIAVQKMEVIKMDSKDEAIESQPEPQTEPNASLERIPLTIDTSENTVIAADIENVARDSEEVFDTVPVHIEIAAAPHEVFAVSAEAIVPPIMVEQHSAIIGELNQKSDVAPKSEKNNEVAQGVQRAIVEKQEVAKPIESEIVSGIVETTKDDTSVHSERSALSNKREEAVEVDSVATSAPVVLAEISARAEISAASEVPDQTPDHTPDFSPETNPVSSVPEVEKIEMGNDMVDAIPVAVSSENKTERVVETVQEQKLAQEIILVAANDTVAEPVQKIFVESREFLDEIFISNVLGENIPQAISPANNNEAVRRAYSNAQAATGDQNDSRETAAPALHMNGITLQRLAIAA